MGRRNRTSNDSDEDDIEAGYLMRRVKIRKIEPQQAADNPKKLSDEERAKRRKEKKLRQKLKKKAAKATTETPTPTPTPTATATATPTATKPTPPQEKISPSKISSKPKPPKPPTLHTLPMGVKYYDLSRGTGPVVPHRSRITVSYIGRAVDEKGPVFDRSANFSFKLGKGEVIKGWDIGLQNITRGTTRVLIIPPKAGYGSKDLGSGRHKDMWFQINVK